jgi:hypothetical protein
MQFDGDQMRDVGFVGGFHVLDFSRPVFQIAAGFEIAAGLEVESRELNLVVVVSAERQLLCAGGDG